MYRHGDVLLVPIPALPVGAVPVKREGELVLARGEATGHAHRLAEPSGRLFVLGGSRYLVLGEPGWLTHEEHATLELPAGRYEVRIQREYTPEGIRGVLD